MRTPYAKSSFFAPLAARFSGAGKGCLLKRGSAFQDVLFWIMEERMI